MAPQTECNETLAGISQKMLELAHKFFRMTEVLPDLDPAYTELAQCMLFFPFPLEELQAGVIALGLADPSGETTGTALLQDIDKLVGFLERLFEDAEEGLPERAFSEVEYDVPYQVATLMTQLEAARAAVALMVAVLNTHKAVITDSKKFGKSKASGSLGRHRLLAENSVSLVKLSIRNLSSNIPDVPKGDKILLSRMDRRSAELKEWFETMLKEPAAEDSKVSEQRRGEVQNDDLETFEEHSVGDARVLPRPSEGNGVYTYINKKKVDEETLNQYKLPWSTSEDDPDRFVVWQSLEFTDINDLIEHTKQARTRAEHAAIHPGLVVDQLLKRWVGAEPTSYEQSKSEDVDEGLQQFEKDLAELKIAAEKSKKSLRPKWKAPPPPPPPGLYTGERTKAWKGVTCHYRTWTADTSILQTSLTRAGWKIVYMRGNDAGQTWFYGDRVIHVRRFDKSYTPQSGAAKTEDLKKWSKTYLIISKEWVEEEAIQRAGFAYQAMEGSWSLDPRLTWYDIDKLVITSSAFREERLFHKYRRLSGGDLHGRFAFPTPDEDYLQGPRISVPRLASVQDALTSAAESEQESEHAQSESLEKPRSDDGSPPASGIGTAQAESWGYFVEVDA